MTWDDDRDFVDDYVDGLTDGIGSGIVTPVTATKTLASTPTLAKSAAISSVAKSGIAASVLKPAPSSAPPASTPPTSSMVLHTPLTTITTPVQKALGPAAASGAAQAFQSAAAKVAGGVEAVLSTPGVTAHVETLPVASDLDARLRAIRGALLAIRAQSEATSEHHSMMNRDSFRRSVIARLSRIESRLPSSSSAAEQIRTIKVLL
jgi:hypothetical protein